MHMQVLLLVKNRNLLSRVSKPSIITHTPLPKGTIDAKEEASSMPNANHQERPFIKPICVVALSPSTAGPAVGWRSFFGTGEPLSKPRSWIFGLCPHPHPRCRCPIPTSPPTSPPRLAASALLAGRKRNSVIVMTSVLYRMDLRSTTPQGCAFLIALGNLRTTLGNAANPSGLWAAWVEGLCRRNIAAIVRIQ